MPRFTNDLIKNTFGIFEKEIKRSYYLDLIDSYKYKIKKTWDIRKEIVGNKRVTNAPLANFITVKNRENIHQKRNCGNL